MDWLTGKKIPVGKTIDGWVDWMTDNFQWFFDGLTEVIEVVIDALLWLLQLPHPVLFAAIVAGIALFARRSIFLAVLAGLSVLLAENLGYWEETTETLALVMATTIFCMAVGVPIGIAASHNNTLSRMLRPVLDLMQTIPTFVYMIPTLVFFGLGMVPGLIFAFIFVLPVPIRFTELGMRATPKALLEAGESFGCTKSQLLWKVELPFALPQIRAGLTQTIMLSLSMTVFAALVAGGGLGEDVVRALNTLNGPMGFEAGILIVLIAITLDRFLNGGADTGEAK